MGIECNLIHQLTNLRRHVHRTLADTSTSNSTLTRTNDPRHAKFSASCERKTITQKPCMRSSERTCHSRQGTSGLALGLAGARCAGLALAARDAVSQGVLRACMGTEVAHLLVEDAYVVLDAISFQGVS